nr:hypothetical protein [Patescibacteria group bacterium]
MSKEKTENKTFYKGEVTQIIGTVVDVSFTGLIPPIYSALKVEVPVDSSQSEKEKRTLVLEVQQHIGSNSVRAVAMGATEGLKRGDSVESDGEYIKIPVGEEVLGRILNVLGQPVDKGEPLKTKNYLPIHQEPPAF